MKRREFLKRTALLTAAVGASSLVPAIGNPLVATPDTTPDTIPDEASTQPHDSQPLLTSAPMLQNYAETSIGVAFAVSSLACGYVLIGQQPDLSDARKVYAGGFRTRELNDHVCLIRITGLQPATTYYYRIGAERIQYKGGYNMKNLGAEDDPLTYRFTTAGTAARAHFCVINDTHASWRPFERAIEKIAQLAPSCVLWNGDASNVEETTEAQMRIFLTPEIQRTDYAAQMPYLFCTGNHDYRGLANRHLENIWMYRQPEERSPRDWDLGRNFALRMGDIAMIGLDTGEDKLDSNPKFANIFNMAAYREAQALWLADALQRPDIASAPYLVAFCHIPLFDSNPKRNPGDIAPNDTDPRYSHDFAMWQRTCARLWTPLLAAAGCQLIITAHQHRYRYDAPTPERPWAQIVGGGPDLDKDGTPPRAGHFPTVIEGEATGGQLRITVHNLLTGTTQDTFSFAPRKS